MTQPLALPQAPTLDGVHLLGADTKQWQILPREISRVHELAGGKRRKDYHYTGAPLPPVTTFYDTVLSYESLGPMRRTVEELLAVPDTHELILWREEPLTWVGDGVRTEFEMPRRLAVDVVTTPPDGGVLSRYYPEVRIGRTTIDNPALTYVPKTSGTYNVGSPAADEAWFLIGGTTFRLLDAPADGAIVYCWAVPVFTVVEMAQGARNYDDTVREPRRIALVEAGE